MVQHPSYLSSSPSASSIIRELSLSDDQYDAVDRLRSWEAGAEKRGEPTVSVDVQVIDEMSGAVHIPLVLPRPLLRGLEDRYGDESFDINRDDFDESLQRTIDARR